VPESEVQEAYIELVRLWRIGPVGKMQQIEESRVPQARSRLGISGN
jgi:hypothetical protein